MKVEKPTQLREIEGSKRKEGFLFSVLLFPCAHVCALVLMIPRLGVVTHLKGHFCTLDQISWIVFVVTPKILL
jgi:hypothetical protein